MGVPDPSERRSIGPYRIVARVGAGGMGEVFKAWDPRLEREVAIKLLHPDAALSPDRQRRLLAEGRAASALNHPNTLRVYDVDVDEDGISYYLVSEWLEGKSLRDELARGPLPLKRLLDLSVQIADGLAAAHSIGIVHRDIKPENVMLARDGTARIVDFGLARSEPSASSLSTAEGHATTVSLEGGLSGTPAYMSPEQARGNAGDFRTDQFSFGALLYEMATGTFAFRRDSIADTLSAVLHEEPKPILRLNPRIPAPLRWIVEQCLAKDASERYSATDDLARELRRVRDRLLETLGEPTVTKARPAMLAGWRIVIALTVATMLGAAIVLGALAQIPDAAPLRFTPVGTAAQYEGTPAWSADGQTLAYAADVDGVLQVFVRRLSDVISHQITRGRFDAQEPFWAPDGEHIYFVSPAGEREALWLVSVAGGRPEVVLENVAQAAIDRDGKRLALLRRGHSGLARADLWWSSPPGAEPTREMRPPFDQLQTVGGQLRFSQDGQLLIWMYDDPGAINPSKPDRSSALYVIPPGAGAPRKLRDGLTTSPNLTPFDWMPDNRHIVVARPDEHSGNRHLWMVDTISGVAEQVTATHTNETFPAVDPRGQRIAYASDEVDFDLVMIAPDGRTRRSVLATARNELDPAWSPIGDQFAFVTDRTGSLGIWARSRDGQWERPIVTDATFSASPSVTLGSLAYSPDGRTLAYQRQHDGTFEIWLSPSTGGTPVRLINSGPRSIRPYQDSPSWSPDGEWILYRVRGRESSTLEKVKVGTAETVDLKVDVLPLSFARWSPDGKWILCETAEGLSRVPSDGGDTQTLAAGSFFAFTWADDSRHVYAIGEGETAGHLAMVEIDSATRAVKILNDDLGPIPVASEPIRGFTFAKGQGFLTSFASARSDIWVLEGFQRPRSWFGRLADHLR